jgi:hypothetical protein
MRLRKLGHNIFGQHAGYTADGRVKFYDEELNKIILYQPDEVEVYEY